MKLAFGMETMGWDGKDLTPAEFAETEEGKTPLGKLFLELLAEDTWGKDIAIVYRQDSQWRSIVLHSEHFSMSPQQYRWLHILEKSDGSLPSMNEIQRMVLDAMEQECRGLSSAINILRNRMARVMDAAHEIHLHLKTK